MSDVPSLQARSEPAETFHLRRTGITFDVAAGWKPPHGQGAASEWIEALKMKLPVDEDGNYLNVMEREASHELVVPTMRGYSTSRRVTILIICSP